MVFSAQKICTLLSLRPMPGKHEDSEEIEQQTFDLMTSDDVTSDTIFLTVFIMHHQSSQEQTCIHLGLWPSQLNFNPSEPAGCGPYNDK
jgi:hypothetical protein